MDDALAAVRALKTTLPDSSSVQRTSEVATDQLMEDVGDGEEEEKGKAAGVASGDTEERGVGGGGRAAGNFGRESATYTHARVVSGAAVIRWAARVLSSGDGAMARGLTSVGVVGGGGAGGTPAPALSANGMFAWISASLVLWFSL